MSSKVSLFIVFILTITLINVESQTVGAKRTTSVIGFALHSGVQIIEEPRFDPLAQPTIKAMAVLGIGGPLQILSEIGFYRAFPSNYSDLWYRYRGFSAFNSLLGLSYHLSSPGISVSILGGSTLARYDYSYSYFFYPQLEFRLENNVFVTSKMRLNLGIGIPIHFRADLTSFGFDARISIMKPRYKKELLSE